LEEIYSFISAYNHIIILAILCLSVITLVLTIINSLRAGRMLRKYEKMMSGVETKNLEQMLTTHIEKVSKVSFKTLEMENALKNVRAMAERSIQNVGIVRYNAFSDTGSDLSFAIALLDFRGNGMVISSLFGRNETRTYAKPVTEGRSTYHLSDEEQEAITKALNNIPSFNTK